MDIAQLWKVRPGRLQREHQCRASTLGQPTQLFHGTSSESIKGILRTGFCLPKQGGMFGRGIYFADCPLKSVRYSQMRSAFSRWQSYALGCIGGCVLGIATGGVCSLCCLAGGVLGSGVVHLCQEGSRQMLICDVFLGKSRTLRGAKDVQPSQDLKRGWLPQLFGARDYDSVCAPGGVWGAVMVTEYIVYQPHQAIPGTSSDSVRRARDGGTSYSREAARNRELMMTMPMTLTPT
eukprot:CAMPEP_0204520980 /NCGR_PEP_ID=MMETSP0661-20131031/5545_1 /ASSEMBLY_ACC=CAM_ASM_000606 /TAXON_ID=109239 /ORGANISM="Alexandrium margalefi, Strain AMGDE01CS-322" /LENGTH=234 /DNA_ID=CAMNT_0051526555 /DNA_START=185 /DNA_END=886 /DNA_ORIENTATION=+